MVKNQCTISPQLSSLVPHGINKHFQHLHIECLINSGAFGNRFKMDDTPDIEKADNIVLMLDFDIRGFFGLGKILQSPLHGLTFGLGILLITCFITSDDKIQKNYLLKLFCKDLTQSEMSVLLFLHQASLITFSTKILY
jgi:hypothetical protein